MKKLIGGLLTAIFVFGLVGCASFKKPEVSIGVPMVEMSKKAKVEISGKGFEPGQKVNLLFIDKNGIRADIGYALKPEPVADDKGEWHTTWSCGRYIKKKLIIEGEYNLFVTDQNYKKITNASIKFGKTTK